MPDDIDEFIEPTPEAAKLSRFDLRSLWRVTFWGAAATLAVVVVAGTALSDVGAERVKIALASALDQVRPAPQTPPVDLTRTAEIEKQTQQLAQQAQQYEKQAQQLRDTVKQLAADRDQLRGRLAILEQSLDDITGAIKRQTAQPRELPKEPPVASAPPPVISAPPTTTASIPESAVTVPTEAVNAAQVPLPPPSPRVAALAPAPVDQPAEPLKKELGVDLGGAASLDALRAHWAAIKANIGPDLVGMHASYRQRTKTSGATEYRLVVGTFPNSAAAIRLCTKLTPMRISCRAGVFEVQQLAER